MATTRIIPMHVNKGKTIAQCLTERTDYAKNPDKTEDGEYISAYACDAKTADSEFLLSKRQYRQLTGREQASDVIAYQIRQSFKPGEVTPEEANQLGYEFARRFTKGDHAFIVCTHTDKQHIHNHIIWNSTTLDCTRKFRNFWGSTEAVRKISDLVCMEHRLSVIENPKPYSKSYNKWLGGKAKPCQRDLLRAAIDAALAKKPEDFEEFLKLVEAAGYTVKRGRHVTFMRDGQPQNIRLRSLGEGYSEEELRAVILGTRVHTPRRKKRYPSKVSRPTLISQIEAKIGNGKGAAYDQKLKVVKLKTMAETLLFIQKHDFADFDALADYADAASNRTKELTAKIKAAESRMAEIAVLKTHIINYAKTRDIYTAYRKAGYSRKYYDAHESDILIHKAAKKAFDNLALKKLPTVKSLQAEYSDLLVQKKLDYAELSKARDEAKRLQIYKANAEMLLRTDVIGTPIFSIPYLGYVADYIQHPPGMYIAISAGAVLLLLVFIPDIFADDKDKDENKKKKSSRRKKGAHAAAHKAAAVDVTPEEPADESLTDEIRRKTDNLLTDDEVEAIRRVVEAGRFDKVAADALRQELIKREAERDAQ